mmetsp:Transcript_10132/g.23872  ORF Transcript_10132/g.23872 Transcript_10132/m.23872 type:complete len:232 (-) Transcript_10132:655-1350(-)
MDAVVAESLDLIHDADHQIIVSRKEVDVRHAKDCLLRDLCKRPLRIRVNGVGTPHIKPDKLVHLREGVKQYGARQRGPLAANQPRGHLRPAEIACTADHIDLLCAVLHKRPHILYGERSVTVERSDFTNRHVIVDLVKGAVFDVATKLLLAVKVHHVRQVKETRPCTDKAHHHHASVPVLGVGPQLLRRHVLHCVRSILGCDLLHLVVEHGILVETIFPCILAHCVEKGIT